MEAILIMKYSFYIFLFYFTSNVIGAQANYQLMLDRHLSPEVGAENLITAHKIFTHFESKLLKSSLFDESNFGGKLLGITYRLTKNALIDFPIDYYTAVFQHEVFGHGYAFRMSSFRDIKYQINLPHPYGPGGGYARAILDSGRVTLDESSRIKSAGVEATGILAKRLNTKWMLSGKIHHRESLLHLLSFYDLRNYVNQTKEYNLSTGDIAKYINTINNRYKVFEDGSQSLNIDDLDSRIKVNSFNTFHLLSVFVFFYDYLYEGNEEFDISFLKIKNVLWIPAFRYGLTPFGPELTVENYFKKHDDLSIVRFRIGDSPYDTPVGLGFTHIKRPNHQLQFSVSADIWYQEPLIISKSDILNYTSEGIGGMLITEVDWFFKQSLPLGIHAEIGYKTSGFIEGHSLDSDVILRFGLSMKFSNESIDSPALNKPL